MKLTLIQKTMISLLVVSVAAVLLAWHIFNGDMSEFVALLNYLGPHCLFAGVMIYLCVRPVVGPGDSKVCRKRWCVACHNYH